MSPVWFSPDRACSQQHGLVYFHLLNLLLHLAFSNILLFLYYCINCRTCILLSIVHTRPGLACIAPVSFPFAGMLSKSIMDLICSEPSPSSPTEKFFDSERELVLGTHSQNKSLTVNDSSLSNGSSVSGHLLPVSHKSDLESHSVTNQLYELSSSPLSAHSEASSGYDSMANISPSSEGEFQLDEINFHSTNCNFDVLTEVFSTRAQFDRHLLDDIRALRQMLQIEHLYVPWGVDQLVYLCDKYETDEKARRIVTEWMLEVCLLKTHFRTCHFSAKPTRPLHKRLF